MRFILNGESLRGQWVESRKPRCGMKSHSAHTDGRAFCTAAVPSAKSMLVAQHPAPPAYTPLSQRQAAPAPSVPGLPFSYAPRHPKGLGTYPESRDPAQLELPQRAYPSATEILSRMCSEGRGTPLRYHSRPLPAHSGSPWT